MAGINNVVLVGRLTKDVNLRSTQSGTMVGTFTLAVDRTTKDQNGNRQADFIKCVVWNNKYSKMAENLATYAHKGSLIGVQGRIQTRNYDNKDGQRVDVTEVRVDNFSLLESRNSAQREYTGQQGGYSQQQGNQPQGNYQASQAANFGQQGQFTAPAGQSDTIDVSNDDLPF
ncbi:putative single strand binding protein [Lactobacillus phage LL-H]|uniref:putative single strand binding protein n=1 Tax=Lactococcus phage LL-H TaxID=12348 RepID=UPI000009B1D7|nr:putative single strand binding protein [Lactobacillus phage LL-H]AAL77550.1 putative single strand binding protein [Lactobacillus phage LL-H]